MLGKCPNITLKHRSGSAEIVHSDGESASVAQIMRVVPALATPARCEEPALTMSATHGELVPSLEIARAPPSSATTTTCREARPSCAVHAHVHLP